MRVRRGEGPAGVRLQREAELLGRARHPGIEELLDQSAQDGTVEVVTAFVRGVPPAHAVGTVAEVAAVIAVLGTTVADLHDIGIAHGALDEERVVVGADGRPVLVGFEHAVAMDGSPRRWPTSALAAADVGALGALVARLLVVVGATRTPPSRWPFAGGRRRGGEPTVRLFALADRARAGTRPALTARTFAAAVLAAVPTAMLPCRPLDESRLTAGDDTAFPASGPCQPPGDASRATQDPRAGHRTAARLSLARLLGLGTHRPALVGGALVLAAGGLAAAPLSCGPRSAAPPATAMPAGPAFYAAGVLTVGAEHFAIGGPGDAVVLGRWTCQKSATVVLLRAATGSVWVFSGWASPGRSMRAVAAGHVPSFVAARSIPAGRCDDLLVTRADGTTTRLRPRAAR